MNKKVVELNLTSAKATQIISELAIDSNRVFFTSHAEIRMKQRGITRVQIIRCLRYGKITEGPYRDINGNWKQTLETISAGESISTVVALDKDVNGNNIVVITCF